MSDWLHPYDEGYPHEETWVAIHDTHDAGMTAWVLSILGVGFFAGLVIGVILGRVVA